MYVATFVTISPWKSVSVRYDHLPEDRELQAHRLWRESITVKVQREEQS